MLETHVEYLDDEQYAVDLEVLLSPDGVVNEGVVEVVHSDETRADDEDYEYVAQTAVEETAESPGGGRSGWQGVVRTLDGRLPRGRVRVGQQEYFGVLQEAGENAEGSLDVELHDGRDG